jgi:hypothetical protein
MAEFPNSESASGIWKLKDIWVAIRGDNWVKDLSGNRGLFAGGDLAPGYSNVIDYIGIASTGNATDFGDLITGVYGNNNGAVGSTTRGLFAGGGGGTAAGINEISYVTIASAGNATDFGDLTEAGRAFGAGISSSTRGVFGPRRDSSRAGTSNDNSDTIDYVTIASTGNATDFGNATAQRANNAGACSSTRGLIAGGNLNTQPGGESSNVIDYITIASTGNATDFGDLSAIKNNAGGLSSSTRALFAGGVSNPGSSPYGSLTNSIDYVTIATTGNATDFGDLGSSTGSAGLSNTVRGVFSESSASTAGSMTYITIASTGNVSTFGDLSVARTTAGSGSNIHGGLQ